MIKFEVNKYKIMCPCRLKNILFLISLLLPMSGFAQNNNVEDKPTLFPKLFGLNKSVSVGIIGGGMECFDYGVIGVNTTIYGFYLDFMGWPRKSVKDVNTSNWEELSVWSSHVGYQIPFHKYQDGSIRLIPMIGYYAKKEGAVFGFNDNTYRTTATTGKFDYGAALVFQSKDDKLGYFDFYVGATKHTIWIGFGIDFSLRK